MKHSLREYEAQACGLYLGGKLWIWASPFVQRPRDLIDVVADLAILGNELTEGSKHFIVDGIDADNRFDNCAVYGLPYKFGLAHFVIFHSLHKEAVFFFGQAGLDHESALGCVVRFGHRHNSFHLPYFLRRFYKVF